VLDMNFALSDDHVLLRDSAAAFADGETRLEPLLIPGATVDSAPYAENWSRIRELGWPGLIVPEAQGGVGLDCIELSLIVTELGRTLMPSPLAGHTFGTWALLAAGGMEQRERWLPEAASGSTTFALVPPLDGNGIEVRGARLHGTHDFVIDAAAADQLVVAARDGAAWRFFLLDTRVAGVEIAVQPWRDVTRQVCRVILSGAAAAPMPGDAETCWRWIHDRISLFLSAENTGGMRRVLDRAVEYAKERVAFGRPIGAYQAIKHPLAEILGQLESSSTAVLFAAWALASGDDRASLAASMAKAYSSDAYVAATHRSIQIFGAIGFTWEMQNHLYYKRARCNDVLFGNAHSHREHIVNLATGRDWSRPFQLAPARDVA
jgi:alkylation response protein AidB-like acyl-CoA dehydrogenase